MTKYHTGYHPNRDKVDSEKNDITSQYKTLQDNVERARQLGDKLPTSAMNQRMTEGLGHLDNAITEWKEAVDNKADFTDETRPIHESSMAMAKDAARETEGAADSLAGMAINNGNKTAATISSSAKRVDEAVERVLKHMQANGKSHEENDTGKSDKDTVITKEGRTWKVNDKSVKDPFYSANYKLKADKDAMDRDSLEKYKGDIIEAIREPGH